MISAIRGYGYSLYNVDSCSKFERIPADVKIAFIDEDFDGPQTGWRLASMLRRAEFPIKIVMITRKNPKEDFIPLYDITLGFPLDIGELISEINRK